MESASVAAARKNRETLITKLLSDRTNPITSLNPHKTAVKSLITSFQNTTIGKKFEENGEPPTPVRNEEPGLVRNPNKRKFAITEGFDETGNLDVNRKKMAIGDSDGFGSCYSPVREQKTPLHLIDDDDDDDDDVVEPMAVRTSRRIANKRTGEEKTGTANRQTLLRKPLSECTNIVRSPIPIEPSELLYSTPKDLKNRKIGTSINKSIGEMGNENANQKCGSAKVDDPWWLKGGVDPVEPMTIYTRRRTSTPLSECTNTITSLNSSETITLIPADPPNVLLSTPEYPKTTNMDTSIDNSVAENGFSNANQTRGNNEVNGRLADMDDAMKREAAAAAKRKGKAKMYPVEEVTATRDESSNGNDVEPSETCIVPPEKEAVLSDKVKERYEAYYQQQKAFMEELDADELMVESASDSE